MSALDRNWLTATGIVLVIIVSTSLLSGCAMTWEVPLNPILPQLTNTDKLPVAIGIYYKPEFRNYKHTINNIDYIAEVGQANVALFNRVFATMFQRSVEIPQLSSRTTAARPVDVIIEPTIEEFDSGPIEIIYRFTLYTPQGARIASWNVLGEGGHQSPSQNVSVSGTKPNAVELAMQEAAIKFMIRFRHTPGVYEWLQQLGVPDRK